MSHKILVVDDDPHIIEVLTFALGKAGMVSDIAANGVEALEKFGKFAPDLVILDINMPRMDGLEACRQMRASRDTPIMFLSSRDDEIDRVLGLELGGDDYVVKPFSPREVVARVKVILKRTGAMREPAGKTVQHEQSALNNGCLSLDLEAYSASWNSSPILLTATEFHLLRTLLGAPRKVFTRDQLMDGAYGTGIAVSDRTIDSHIRHIRTKFAQCGADNVIDTVHGIGYRLGRCDLRKPAA